MSDLYGVLTTYSGVVGEPTEQEGRTGRRVAVGALRGVAVVLTVLILVAGGTGWVLLNRADQQVQANAVTALVPDDPNIRLNGVAAAGDGADGSGASTAVTTGPAENILILGLDTRPPETVKPGEGTSQSDVIMIAHVSADRQRVDLVSIPRDLLIPAPTCKAWDYATNSLSDHDFDNHYAQWKITNAYAVGGPQCTVRAVQALTGARIDRVIIFDFQGFKAIVDAMGGVTMTFPGPVVDNGKTIIDAAGTRVVNGDQALALVRARRVAGDPTGDIGRIARQQQLLTAMLTQATDKNLLADPSRLTGTVQTILNQARTDNVTVQDLVDLAVALKGSDAQVNRYTLPTVNDTDTDGQLAGPGMSGYLDALAADQPLPAASR